MIGVGKTVERGEQHVKHTDSAAGVEIVIHVLQELLPMSDRLRHEFCRRLMRRDRLARARRLQVEEALVGDPLEALEEAIKSLDSPADFFEPFLAEIDRAPIVRGEK